MLNVLLANRPNLGAAAEAALAEVLPGLIRGLAAQPAPAARAAAAAGAPARDGSDDGEDF